MIGSENGVISVTVTQEKWMKTKSSIEELLGMLEEDENNLNHKRIERIHEYLSYVVWRFVSMKPYLKGLHLTLDS